jgi:cytochrome d ubiquinol oxidase subunit II
VAVATFFTGANFSLNNMNQVQWSTSWYGLEALMNIRNLALGLAVLLLARVNGLLYILNTIDDEDLVNRAKKNLIVNSVLFLIFFLFFVISLLLSTGFAADPLTGNISMEKYKYLHNFIQMPFVLVIFLAGVAGVLFGIAISVYKSSRRGIWYSGAGTVLAVFSLFIIAGFNDTSFYPSLHDLKSSLTIVNASSSLFTLKTMMYVSFIIPFVIAYIWFAWKAINNENITEEELDSGEHKY